MRKIIVGVILLMLAGDAGAMPTVTKDEQPELCRGMRGGRTNRGASVSGRRRSRGARGSSRRKGSRRSGSATTRRMGASRSN